MKKIKHTLKQLWQDESGQGATEYMLLLAVLIVIVVAFKGKIKTIIENRTGEVGDKLKNAIGNI